MTDEGEFILLQVAVSFLTNDYEYCLRIADTDFSYVDISALFEGNILRYRSLASLKLFEHAKKEPHDYAENFKLLVYAIDSLRNAQDIYNAKNDKM